LLEYDTRLLDDERREALAWRIHGMKDFQLPPLKAWNYELCRQHRMGWPDKYWDKDRQEEVEYKVIDRPKPGCRKCGIHFRAHQRVGVAWLYLRKKALLADTMGTGKTTNAAGLIAMLIETGELADKRQGGKGRVVIIPRAAALHQWHDELLRMMPGLNIVLAQGPAQTRNQLYLQDWQVLLIGPEMVLRDSEKLDRFDFAAVITDDVDTLRNPENRQAYQIKRMGRAADRFVIMTGTPLQKRLVEMHSVLSPLGGDAVFGNLSHFESMYIRRDVVVERDEKTGTKTSSKKITGYRNLDDFKSRMAPMVLRRTAADISDATMPAVQTNDVMLDLYPRQRAKYKELQTGVLKILKDEGTETKHTTALTQLHYGSLICGGLATLGEPDEPLTSVKMDWLLSKLTGELEDEKVVVFAKFKNSVTALHERFRQAGIGYTTVWGENKKQERREAQETFWTNPKCRVLIGTQAIEQSLNLQVSRHLVNLDQIMNQARMEQLAGRVRRLGSAHETVYVHNLLTTDTQEERYLPLLQREAAVAGHVWDEESPLFQALSPLELMHLITG
jgi:non-specific serine/threonine protein kinase